MNGKVDNIHLIAINFKSGEIQWSAQEYRANSYKKDRNKT